jgi:glycosyltransferase involved in cell wall biosynthesis
MTGGDEGSTTPSIAHVMVVSHDAHLTGAPKVALEVVKTLRALGSRVTVVLKERGRLTEQFSSHASTLVSRPYGRALRLLARLHVYPGRFSGSRWAGALDVRLARRVIRRSRPSLVYANTLASADYAIAAVAEGVPAILHSHEMDPFLERLATRFRLSWLASKVAFVACSHPVREALVAHGIPLAEVTVLESPIDVEGVRALSGQVPDRGSDREGPLIVACGGVEHHKGADLFLAAVRELLAMEGGPLPTCVWIGKGPELPRLRAVAEDPAFRGRVHFAGEMTNPFPIVGRASVYVLPSRSDSFPLAVLEAMALGRPIVAFRVGGVAGQLGDAGILCDPEDDRAMARAIRRLLDRPDEARRLGAAAQQRASRYDLPEFRRRLACVLENHAATR